MISAPSTHVNCATQRSPLSRNRWHSDASLAPASPAFGGPKKKRPAGAAFQKRREVGIFREGPPWRAGRCLLVRDNQIDVEMVGRGLKSRFLRLFGLSTLLYLWICRTGTLRRRFSGSGFAPDEQLGFHLTMPETERRRSAAFLSSLVVFGPASVSAGDRPQFAGHEMVRRPGSGDADLAVFEMPGRGAIAVLILGDGGGVDKVGEIYEHSAGVGALADHVFLQRREQFVDLHREGAGLGLPFSHPRRLLP